MNKELEKALASCLEAMQQGESLEQCLARYPHLAGELESLLRTALAVQQLTRAPSRPEFRAAAWGRLLASLNPVRPVAPKRRAFTWPAIGGRWAVAIASLLVVLLGWSTVSLAYSSVPNQPLYPVKIATEEVRLAFAADKASLEMEFTERRTAEITELASRNRPQHIEEVSQRLERHLKRLASMAASQGEGYGQEQAELETRLERRAARHRAALERAIAGAPPSARPALHSALERSDISFEELRREIRRARKGLPPKINGEKDVTPETPLAGDNP